MGHPLLLELDPVSPVEGAHVSLNGVPQRGPVVAGLRVGEPPAKMAGVLEGLPQQRPLVEQFLGDAAHIDACAPQAPQAATRGRLHEVQHGRTQTEHLG